MNTLKPTNPSRYYNLDNYEIDEYSDNVVTLSKKNHKMNKDGTYDKKDFRRIEIKIPKLFSELMKIRYADGIDDVKSTVSEALEEVINSKAKWIRESA